MATGDALGALCGSAAMCIGPLGFFALFFGIMALGIYFSYISSKKRDESMKQFAVENGLLFTGGGFFAKPGVSGSYKGHKIEMGYFTRTEGSGKHRHTHTYFYTRMFTNTAPMFSLGLSREGVFSWIGKSVGVTHEVQVGDEAFDKEYLISTNDALRAKRVLAPEVRQKIDGLFDLFRFSSFSLEGGSMYIQKEMSSIGLDELRGVGDAMGSLAEAVDKY